MARAVPTLALLLGLLGLLMLTGCEEKNAYVPPPPPQVTVSRPTPRPVTDYMEFTGNTKATETVELRARVEGFLESVHFEDGALVKQGDLLFVIDPKPFEASLKQAEAEIQTQEARLRRAETELARNERLLKQNAVSEADVVQWRVERDSTRADLAGAQAKADLARLNLSYTRIAAPFDGRIGRRLKDPGNLVGAGEATLLATIEKINPIYAYFNVGERDVLRVREMRRERGYSSYRDQPVPVHLGLQIEESYPHQGRVDFADIGVDPNTGTLLVRGVFPNADNVLLPGLFIRLRIPIAERDNALTVSERAIGIDQRGRYVLVVNDQNVVEPRPVKVGALVDGMRVIEDGLRPDDWVIVNGLQKARPGAPVKPTRE